MNGSRISAFVLAISLSLLAFFVVFIFIAKVTAGRRHMSGRVTSVMPEERSVLAEIRDGQKESARKGKKSKSLFNIRLMDVISNELSLAGVVMRPEEFSVLWLIVAFLPSGLDGLFTRQLMSACTLAVVGAAAPIFFLNQRKKKRTLTLETQLGDALIVVCNCLRSGLTFQQAMETISKEMTEPINVEFGRALNELNYGVSLEKALNDMGKRIKSPDLMLTISAVNIQRQTGGNLSEILETISETIKERMKIKHEIKSMTAQGRVSGMIIGALPIAIMGILMIMSPDYIKLLFTESLGRIMLIIGGIMEVIGFFVIKKIVTIKY